MGKEYYLKNKDHVLSVNAKYREKHREEILSYKRAYNKEHRLELLEKRKEYYKRNKAKSLASANRYREKNKRYINKWQVEYAKRNPEVGARVQAKRRKAKHVDRSQDVIIKKWMLQIKNNPFARCHWCGTKIAGSEIHFDHVVALAKGGSHTIGNLCSACPECNHSKGARAIAEWVVGGQTFIPL